MVKGWQLKIKKVIFLPSFVENPMLDNGRAAACSLCSPLSLFKDPGATLCGLFSLVEFGGSGSVKVRGLANLRLGIWNRTIGLEDRRLPHSVGYRLLSSVTVLTSSAWTYRRCLILILELRKWNIPIILKKNNKYIFSFMCNFTGTSIQTQCARPNALYFNFYLECVIIFSEDYKNIKP